MWRQGGQPSLLFFSLSVLGPLQGERTEKWSGWEAESTGRLCTKDLENEVSYECTRKLPCSNCLSILLSIHRPSCPDSRGNRVLEAPHGCYFWLYGTSSFSLNITEHCNGCIKEAIDNLINEHSFSNQSWLVKTVWAGFVSQAMNQQECVRWPSSAGRGGGGPWSLQPERGWFCAPAPPLPAALEF